MSKTTIPTGGLTDSAVTTAKITDATIASGDLADDAVTAAKIADAVGLGKVLQVVTSIGTNVTSTSSTSYSTNMTVSITPSATSSKVLVIHAPPSSIYLSNNSIYGHAVVSRESGGSDTVITSSGHNSTWGIYRLSSGNYTTGSAIHILDSPSTTNSIDYKIRVKVDNTNLTMTYGHDSSQACMSTLTAIEIGA